MTQWVSEGRVFQGVQFPPLEEMDRYDMDRVHALCNLIARLHF